VRWRNGPRHAGCRARGGWGLRKPPASPSAPRCAAVPAGPPAGPHRAGGAEAPGSGRRWGRAQSAARSCRARSWGARGAPRNFLPASAHHILFSPRRVRILGCVSPVLPHRRPRRVRRRVWGRAAAGKTLPGGRALRPQPARALVPLRHCPACHPRAQSLAGNPRPRPLPRSPAAPGSHIPTHGAPARGVARRAPAWPCPYTPSGSAARLAPCLLSAPFTALGLRQSRAGCCSASAGRRAGRRPRTPGHSHPQTAAVCAGGQSPPAAPVQQALGCPAQIGVCRATPQAVLAATHTLAAHRPPQGSRGWGRTCRSRTGLGASSPRPLPAAPEHPGPDAVLALARGKAARGSPAPDHPAGAQRSQRPEPAEAGCARGTEAARRRGRSVPPVAGAIWSRSCGHCHVCHGDGEPRRAEGRA